MAISYPVDVANTRWSVLQVSTGEIVARNRRWPREDGGEIQGQDPDFVYLLQVRAAQPDYDSRVYQLVATEVVDAAANTITTQWTTQARSTDELVEAAYNEESYQATRHIPWERVTLETALVLGLLINYQFDAQQIPANLRPFILSYRDKVKDKLAPNRARLLALINDINASNPLDYDAGWADPDA